MREASRRAQTHLGDPIERLKHLVLGELGHAGGVDDLLVQKLLVLGLALVESLLQLCAHHVAHRVALCLSACFFLLYAFERSCRSASLAFAQTHTVTSSVLAYQGVACRFTKLAYTAAWRSARGGDEAG